MTNFVNACHGFGLFFHMGIGSYHDLYHTRMDIRYRFHVNQSVGPLAPHQPGKTEHEHKPTTPVNIQIIPRILLVANTEHHHIRMQADKSYVMNTPQIPVCNSKVSKWTMEFVNLRHNRR